MIRTLDLIPELFSSSKSIVLVTDRKYKIRYVSEAVEKIFHVKPFALIGKDVFAFVPPGQRANWQQGVRNVDATPRELTLPGPAGSLLHFDVSVSNHIHNERIQGLVIHLHDITGPKADLQKLEDANEHLDHFIFKATHDLRAPLHSAMGLLHLAQRAPANEQSIYFEKLHETLLKLEGYIDEVNSFYRNDKLSVSSQEIDFRKLVDDELAWLSNHPSASDVEVAIDIRQDAVLFSDPIRVKTILANILSNAFKYKDPAKTRKLIWLEAVVSPTELHLSIRDNGLGIAGSHLTRVFDIFYRANDTTTGTGLGLYIVKDTVQRLEGTISVQSKLSEGTTFSLSIPNRVMEMAAR